MSKQKLENSEKNFEKFYEKNKSAIHLLLATSIVRVLYLLDLKAFLRLMRENKQFRDKINEMLRPVNKEK